MSYIKLNKEQQDAFIIDCKNNTMSAKELSIKYQISLSTVSRILKRNNITKHRKRKIPKYKYMEGMVIGNLKIIEITQEYLYKDNTYYAICECLNCGNKNYKTRPYDIITGKILGCGCLKNANPLLGEHHPGFRGYKRLHKQKWTLWEIGAKNRGLDFDIKMQYAYEILEKQNFICNLSGLPIDFSKNNRKDPSFCTASLDRINSNIGYVPGNIQWVHKDINYMKRNFTDEYFILLCKCIGIKDKNSIDLLNFKNNEKREKSWDYILNNRIGHWNQLHKSRENSSTFKGYKDISGEIWLNIKNSSKSRDIDFIVTIQEAYELFLKQNRICNMSGLNIWFGRTAKEKRTASLDRIDSQKNYSLDNLQWVHRDVNMLKVDFELKYFVELCQKVANHAK